MLMTTYRLLWLDEDGYPLKSAHIECTTDRAAVDIARDHTGDFEVIEIWDGGRFICGCGNPHEGSPG
jgi:hypothetical protein